MTIVIDEVAALDALRKTVEIYGEDHKVSQCAYSQPEGGWEEFEALDVDSRLVAQPAAPLCILGCAFHDVLGVPLHSLRAMDSSAFRYGEYSSKSSDGIASAKTLNVLADAGIKVTAAAVDVFEVAQQVQDNGEEWGYALAKAEAYAEKLRNGEVA